MSSFYVGNSADLISTQLGKSRYLYALRRNEDGELFLKKFDQIVDQGFIEINKPGPADEDYVFFEEGVDFYDGIDEEHEPTFENMTYPQYRWDSRSSYFYVDDNGQFVMRVYREYIYPEGISS